MTARRWARLVAVACVLALPGCSSGPVGPAGPGTAPTFHLAQVGFPPPGATARISVERVEAPPRNEAEWTVEAVDPASASLSIAWTDGGTPECGQVDRIRLFEDAESVVVGLEAAHRDPQIACVAVGSLRSTTLDLRRPLGRRALVEATTGVNDGLPTTASADALPGASCSTNANPRDVPVGMLDARSAIAPLGVTRATICRTWWPKGSAHVASRTIADPSEVRSLVEALRSGATGLRPAESRTCAAKARGSIFGVLLEGPRLRVAVRADEISCRSITNGAASGTMTPTLMRTLDALFSS